MKYLSLQEVQIMHDDIINEIGGLKGANPKQIALLDSALTQIQNDDYYPSFIDKLTHLMFACVKFHPSLECNKRTALYIAKAFIKLNRPDSLPADFYQRLEDVIVSVASDEISKDELAQILSAMLKGN
ncbi:Fic family protein [Helicobacter bilis]|uniref:Type II toxin-antitoxin system death-on-curing family toxin n=1 Tax=Helicobacter bilis TaxID=37372 RepID=A0A4U8U6A3_9HELI|nr:Fic family protein [Helicobacter bilis]MCI7410838.1 type II toxin-antitoxin system death-on-curing family toxin [Helicobacter bilis]MDD7297262.1 type II toxin-antitoxin system death-on-curing family toxin [Helicobacter bilis]MDY4400667.1 type II toxin-antitoxin system death-on-curing family toxin [Helicobacter bilis]TLE07432.1 type II toxin-antitoxin system death-on-curing family toxin [Helicobacter bilis]TLE08795.1 type II toxin-antitoxin system death-on-curing family toxin [Helicobacter b